MDVQTLKALVNLGFDGFSTKKQTGRSEVEEISPAEMKRKEKEEKFRNLITYSLGGLMQKQVILIHPKMEKQEFHFQDCYKRSLCQLGAIFKDIKGTALIFL